MTSEDYGRHVVGLLCWHCHAATTPCHARQQQCPRCRRKWSYDRRRTRWEWLKAFCLHATAHHAARRARCDYRTAYRASMRFRLALAEMADEEKRPLLGELELDASSFGGRRKGKRGRGAAGKVAVLGILERDGRAYTQGERTSFASPCKEVLEGVVTRLVVREDLGQEDPQRHPGRVDAVSEGVVATAAGLLNEGP